MKYAALTGILLLAAALPAGAELAVDDILKLHRAGVEADTIVTLIRANEQVFRLETEEIIALKQAGVPETVIRTMIETALSGPPAGGETGEDEPVVLEDGSILLTNIGKDGARSESSPRTNVVPSRPAEYYPPPASYRTPVPSTDGAYVAAMPLPPADLTAQAPVVREDRGYYGIGHRWHPSWNQPRNQFPVGAYVDAGGGYYRRGYGWGGGSGGAGYYFLPSSFGPRGSSFGQFGFHLNQSRYSLYDYRPLGSLYLHPSFRPK
jgi:hypothetical protein